jgi:hypothetical protein
MFIRTRQRIARLEEAIVPRGRVFSFIQDETSPIDSGLAPYAERLATFKAENGVGPRDTLIQVVIRDEAPAAISHAI